MKINKMLATFVFLLFIGINLYSQEPLKPLIVLIEQNPWLFVFGADSPSFALYNNGEVIFIKRNDSKKMEYVHVLLDTRTLKETVQKLSPQDDFYNLKDYYDLTGGVTDQITQIFLINLDGKNKKVRVYGNLSSDKEARKNAPNSILDLFDKLIHYDNENSKKWLPEKIEVMIWPNENARNKSISWPKDWPNLQDKNTKKRREDFYSIYLDSSKYEELLSLGKRSGGNTEIDGRFWAFSIRFPFPCEEVIFNN